VDPDFVVKTMDLHDATNPEEIQDFVGSALKEHQSNKILVLFFDEINTTLSMDAVAALMCERAWREFSLPGFVRLAAACNPLRKLADVKGIDQSWLPRSSRKEVGEIKPYQVLPLTARLERFCWNFGFLSGLFVVCLFACLLFY
jgi:hypothetical protein